MPRCVERVLRELIIEEDGSKMEVGNDEQIGLHGVALKRSVETHFHLAK